MRHFLVTATAVLALGPAAVAQAAGDPIMSLSAVKPGMRCTARTVVRGTAITTFDIEVVDVVQGDAGAGQPFILFKASGAAIDATGIGPGFSGSPIYCPDDAGTQRVIGAISQGVGEYGNKSGLATPIELILGEPVDAPKETRALRAAPRGAHPLAMPLSVGGLAPKVATIVDRAARRAKRVLYAAPGRPRQAAFGGQSLVPGSAMAVGLASGDFTAGAVGTVAYVDGDQVWSFGHPLDSAGRRSLFLEDAYVYDVVNNPLGSGDLTTYKYATAGHDVGTLTNHGVSAVVGRLGALPERFPLQLIATDLDTGKVRTATVNVADESAIGLPNGYSALSLIGGVAITQLSYLTLGGLPLRQSGSMCVRFTVREATKPMRFCNAYVGGTGGGDEGGGGPMVSDFASAASEFDIFNFGPLHITGVQVNVKLRRSLRLAYLLRIVKAPSIVRRGHTFTATVEIQRQNGPKSMRQVKIRVPRGMPAGERALTLTGTEPDGGVSGSAIDALTAILDLSGEDESGDGAGARTVKGVAKHIADLHRDDGVFAAFVPLGQQPADPLDEEVDAPEGPEAVAQKPRKVLADPELRIAGSAKRRILVLS